MGYNTIFEGELKFNKELTGSQLSKLKSYLGEDAREHPEWNAPKSLDYIDLVMLDDFSGIQWNDETEKTYGMIDMVNFITGEMRNTIPEFCFTGEFIAQGEDFDDRWKLQIDENGKAFKKEIIMDGKKVTCPHCEGSFCLE